ncbi:MAG: hypothetical protein AAF196_09275 [Planctomycetota bacterium]
MNWKQVIGLQSAEGQSGPLGLALLIFSCGGLAVYGASDAFDFALVPTLTAVLTGLVVFVVSIRHLRACCVRLPSSGIDAYRAYNLGLSIVCVAFSIIAVTILVILIANGDLSFGKASMALGSREIARVLWVSAMVAALGASFYCLRKMGSRFGAESATTTMTVAEDEGEGWPQAADGVTAVVDEEGAAEGVAEVVGEPDSPEPEHFVVAHFWSGLWYRVAQAEVYTIVLFLAIWGGAAGAVGEENRIKAQSGLLALPLLALFVGLFIRAAEELIAGLAERLFAMVRALLPRSEAGGDAGR